jgi:hypothetical protein
VTQPVPPEIHFYQSFRAAMRQYLDATRRYRDVLDAYAGKHPGDDLEAELDAATDRRFKQAMNDQKFFGQEVIMYGIAYLVQTTARRTWEEETGGNGP